MSSDRTSKDADAGSIGNAVDAVTRLDRQEYAVKAASSILEKEVKDRVKRHLKKHGAYWFMPVQTGYGATTLDFLVCHRGRFLAIETKRPGKHMTSRQQLVKENIEAADGHVLVVGSVYWQDLDTFSGESELEAWLLLGP